jgi:NADH pyrophosphatase NudC (nudix superfamily)
LESILLRIYKVLPWPAVIIRKAMWLLNVKYYIAVTGVILNSDDEILLLKHTYREHPWGMLTGILTRHETPQEAVVREIREELGVHAEVVGILDVWPYENARRFNVAFLCSIAPNSLASNFKPGSEISEVRFYKLRELPENKMTSYEIELIHQLFEFEEPMAGEYDDERLCSSNRHYID